MSIRSMTAFAQTRGQVVLSPPEAAPNGSQQSALQNNAPLPPHPVGFTLSLKSVNHRFLDLHFRMPSGSDSLEMKLRRLLKEKLARGHVELTLSLERTGNDNISLNRQIAGGYIQAFRVAAAEYGLNEQPDLNVIFRMPGALDGSSSPVEGELEPAVLAKVDEVLGKLNRMREEEGAAMERELRQRLGHIQQASDEVKKFRSTMLKTYAEKLRSRLQELLGSQIDPERILQEAALLVDRSEIQEELVRLDTHVSHFLGMLDEGGEVGKKLDFLLQEMNREANTLLSKTSGLAGEALRITEMGLAMKAEIEKAREQAQNIE
jgi:uncharacterized protein (TIGR00255 family)